MTDDDMRAIYKRDEYGYSLGQSLDADKERRWRVKFLVSTIGMALAVHALIWLLS